MKPSTSILVATMLGSMSLGACTKEVFEKSSEFDQTNIVFGSFAGECMGESCIEIFRLDTHAQTLDEDTQDSYPNSSAPYSGTFVPRSQADFNRVKDLAQLIPANLLLEQQTVIGQPDAGDWGGYYLEVSQAGQRRFWLIDTQKANLPTYLHAFTDSLRIRLQKLR